MIMPEDHKIFDESFRLRNEMHRLEEECREQLSQRGKISDEKFKEYLDAANKWQTFFNENIKILAAKVSS